MRTLRLLPCLLFALPLLPSSAQNYTPQKLVFTGADAYKAADLIAVTGLTPGKPVTAAEIDVAMQHLVDTGLFSDMRYTVDGKALTFALTPIASDQLLTARYANFVWWKPQELTPLVHARIPLFDGHIPVTGTMKDQVASALTALVLEKGVKAEVTSVSASDRIGEPVSRTDFSISYPPVRVGEVRIDQVSGAAAAKIDEIRKRFVGQEYDVDQTAPALVGNLRDAYLDLGYLDIAADPPAHSAPREGPAAILVDLTETVREGSVYRVSQMVWPESAIVPKASLSEAASLKAGDPASRIELLSTVAKAERRFAAAGYIDAKMSVEPRKDEARHEVAYNFSVTPGEQYALASVKTLNLSADQQAEFDRNDKLVPGKPYNEDEVRVLIQKLMTLRPFQGYEPHFGRMANPKTHLVTITFSFTRQGSRPPE